VCQVREAVDNRRVVELQDAVLLRGLGTLTPPSCLHSCLVYVSTRQHTSAYVRVRQHTSERIRQHTSERAHTSAYASIRQHTPAYACIRQYTSAYVPGICGRQARGACLPASTRALLPLAAAARCSGSSRQCWQSSDYSSAYASIRQHTSAYASIRQYSAPVHRANASSHRTTATASVFLCLY
jgi:hypothetical protein